MLRYGFTGDVLPFYHAGELQVGRYVFGFLKHVLRLALMAFAFLVSLCIGTVITAIFC